MVFTRSMTRRNAEQAERNAKSKSIPCIFFNAGAGYCRHAEDCYYSHAMPLEDQASQDESCMICYENPQSWGLLETCSHIFCLSCITKWRKLDVIEMDDTNTDNQRACPVCRTKSRSILPSNYLPSKAQKERLLATHISRCASQPCKYFQQFLPGKTFAGDPLLFYCPYFNDCLFKHEFAGNKFIFDEALIERQKSWLEHQNDDLFEYMSETDSDFSDTSMSDLRSETESSLTTNEEHTGFPSPQAAQDSSSEQIS